MTASNALADLQITPPRRAEPRYIELGEQELAKWPGVTWGYLDRGGSHPLIVIQFGQQSRRHGVVTSGGDQDGALMFCRDLRRMCADMGAGRVRPERGDAERIAKEHRPKPPVAAPRAAPSRPSAPRAHPIPDPLEPLAKLHRNLTWQSLQRWAGVNANQDRIDEAARILIAGWHPDIIARAARLIDDATEQP